MAASMLNVFRSQFINSTNKLTLVTNVKRSKTVGRCLFTYLKGSSKVSSNATLLAGNIFKLSGKHGGLRLPSLLPASSNLFPISCYSTEAATNSTEDDYHSIIKDNEKGKGQSNKMEFQAETRKLLDIVARSLYSEKEVFIRELVSNASDALEKLRYLQMQNESGIVSSESGDVGKKPTSLEIHIAVDDSKKTFTIQDTGIGMTKDEIIENLGIIAKSGSKAFIQEVEGKGGHVDKNIIGQFGVGFYSSFMVADKVEVFTKSYKPNEPAYKWQSDGLGTYELSEAENVQQGTKIVMHLKGDAYDFAKEDVVKGIIKKYSNFVGVPIFLNGHKVNVIQALWTMEPRDVTAQMHEDFYRFISNTFDQPRFYLHYKTDAPLNIRALFYVPEYKPTLFDMSRDTEVSLSLYSRKVMIMSKASNILPRWLRFIKGVVDSEDIPLNLSRELLQDSALIRKLRWVLTNRLIKFFLEQAKKDKTKYLQFYKDYGLFFREGIVTTTEQDQREEIARLLRFESSKLAPGELTNLDEYASRMKAGTRNIYYLSAPSRHLAETSPYMESLAQKDVEVLFLYENYDELVLMNLGQYDKKHLKSIENDAAEEATGTAAADAADATTAADGKVKESLSAEQCDDMIGWMQAVLGHRVNKVKTTKRLVTHPCIITVNEMGAARHFLRTALADRSEEEKFKVLQPTLEVNSSHQLIVSLHKLKSNDPDLARMVTEQLFDNAMIAAGLLDDPRKMLGRLNDLMTRALNK
ncbi:hypothetical protein HELRODRAFT_191087 [Helobdella robusta]|uniref:Heat shock protein 75 kDa, mitochondrial n=1 Tax=Helobdella robusta TaxID=6412 RepID=T1FSK7_HELRO|nr:hypothetical protein HELRODRAFT_191087 [Helobdella robusta]ESO07190.1 hypothetical protein HELRODRAFT_191087 [Helobdella robusta]